MLRRRCGDRPDGGHQAERDRGHGRLAGQRALLRLERFQLGLAAVQLGLQLDDVAYLPGVREQQAQPCDRLSGARHPRVDVGHLLGDVRDGQLPALLDAEPRQSGQRRGQRVGRHPEQERCRRVGSARPVVGVDLTTRLFGDRRRLVGLAGDPRGTLDGNRDPGDPDLVAAVVERDRLGCDLRCATSRRSPCRAAQPAAGAVRHVAVRRPVRRQGGRAARCAAATDGHASCIAAVAGVGGARADDHHRQHRTCRVHPSAHPAPSLRLASRGTRWSQDEVPAASRTAAATAGDTAGSNTDGTM